MKIDVTNIDELYDAVDKPANAGADIVLAPGIYQLEPTKGLNAGRIEFQENMTLSGVADLADLVIIDASKLPNTSFNPPLNFPAKRTGAIRMGKGFNKLEWLKVIGNANAQPLSVVDTDLIFGNVSRIRIAHCIVTGGRIGINIRNVGPACDNRTIQAEIKDNEIMGNLVSDVGTQQGQGIVMQNANGVSGAVIKASLNGNHVHGNIRGMRLFNNNANAGLHNDKCSISVESHADRFKENQTGINLDAGTNSGVAATVNGNLISFEAHGTSIQNNRGINPDAITLPCGIRIVGGSSSTAGADASNNRVVMKLMGCKISGNEDVDIRAYGAFSTTPTLAGTNNTVEIFLQGISKNATIIPDDSQPDEPAGTNRVIIHN